jgi:hypothetical protein
MWLSSDWQFHLPVSSPIQLLPFPTAKLFSGRDIIEMGEVLANEYCNEMFVLFIPRT